MVWGCEGRGESWLPPLQEEDMKTIKTFLDQRRPDVIVIAAESRWVWS